MKNKPLPKARQWIFPLLLTVLFGYLQPTSAMEPSTLPDLISYSFSASETKTLPGTSTEDNAGSGSCNGTLKTEDQIGRLALAALFYQNSCYTDGRYNYNNYQVKRGTVIDNGNTLQFDAYQVYEPTNKATEFLASQHAVYYQFPTKEDYTVYRFEGNQFAKVLEITASQIDTTQFIQVANNGITLKVSRITGTATYVFVPSSQRVSTFTELATGIEGARVKSTALGDVLKYRYTVAGTPFDTKLDFNQGPNIHSNSYSRTRQFFLVQKSTGQPGIVWQDKEDQSIQLTWLGSDLKSQTTVALANSQSKDLVAAVHDASGSIYYLTIEPGDGADTETARTATLYKVNDNGQQLAKSTLDTSKTGLNMVKFDAQNIASLQYLNGKLGLIVGRQMHQSSDGLNHQGAIAVVFDANTLNVDKNWGQTSGHSFESVLTTNSQGEFLGIDLGDNYPRGVHLHKFTASQKKSRVVYTFKTQHGNSAQSPAGATYPEYTEISGGGTTYYKWSNDNRTYTELGGVIEGSQGYTVTFAGEASPTNKALDNSRVGNYLNDPRNIGLIQVIKNFENASGSGNVVSDDLVRTSGLTETGGFYTFGGSWSDQRNTGVVWLTNYQDKAQENVSRLKTVKLSDGNLLLLWEKWTPYQYVNSYAMKVSETGQKLAGPVELGSQVRFNRRDDAWVLGNQVYWIAGDKAEKKLELFVLDTSTLAFASGYPKTASVTHNALDLLAKTNENSKAYYIVLVDGAAAPSAAQVKAGQDSDGFAALGSGSVALLANVEAGLNVTGLTPETAYDIFVVAEDASGNPTAVVKVDVSTTTAPDTTPPTVEAGYPKTVNVTPNTLDLLAKTNENSKAYYIVLVDGAAVPSADQVKAGQDSNDNAVAADKKGDFTLTANTEAEANVTGLATSTAYDIFVVTEDGVPNLTEVVKVDVSTTAAPDTTPPTVEAGYPKTVNVTPNTLDLLAKTNENSKAYYIVLVDGAAVPSADQVKAGQDSNDNAVAADKKGDFTLTANTEAEANVTGLATSTAYDIFVVTEDGVPNLTEVVTVDVSTTTAPDTTPPTVEAGYPKTANVTHNALDLLVKADEDGKAYYIVLVDNATAPTAAQVKAGQDSTGTAVAADKKGDFALTANTEATANLAGLATSTAYDIFVVAEDGVPNLTEVVTVDVSTTAAPDTTPPTVEAGYPKTVNVTPNTLDLLAKTNEDGKAYYIVLVDGATTPSAVQVKAGQDSNDNAVAADKKGTLTLTANTETEANLAGLVASTAYDIFVVAEDGVPNLTVVVKVDVSTTAAPDTTPPTVEAGYPKTASVTHNALDLLVKANEDGKAYYIVLVDNATAPTAAQVKAGQDSNDIDVGPKKKGTLALTANAQATATVTGLTPSTIYNIFVVAQNDSGNPTAVVKVDVSTTAAPVPVPAPVPNPTEAPACPTTGTLNQSCDADGQTLTDLVVPEGGNLSNATLNGKLINRGRVSNLTVTPKGVVSGGIVSGYIKNKGTMKDFEFRGGSIIGGTLAGTVINNSQVGGYFQDLRLAPDAHIKGGKIVGEIHGDIDDPALLENLEVKPNSHLTGVIIGKRVQLPKNVSLGAGVRFSNREDIPHGLDLTPLLPSITAGEIDQSASVDLNADIIVDGEGILKAINAIPDFAEANLIIHQNDDDTLQLDVEGTRFVVNPLMVRQTQDRVRLQVEVSQTVRFKTHTQLEVLAQPAVQALEALQAALAELNLQVIRVSQKTGNLQIKTTETDEIWYSARPDFASEVVEDEAETGLIAESVAQAFLTFIDDDGQKRQQLFYPAPANMAALLQSDPQMDLTTAGILHFRLAGKTYEGVLDYLVVQGEATDNGVQVREIADSNYDGLEDFLITYPDGAQQMLWRLGFDYRFDN